MWVVKCHAEGNFDYRLAVEMFSPSSEDWRDELERKSGLSIANPLVVMDIIKEHSYGFLRVKEVIEASISLLGEICEIHPEINLPRVKKKGEHPYLEIEGEGVKIRGLCDALFVHENGLVFYDWKTNIPDYAVEKYRAQVNIYMELARRDDTFRSDFAEYTSTHWLGWVVALQESDESEPFLHDPEKFSQLMSTYHGSEEMKGEHCRWFCPVLNDRTSPCREYSGTLQARTLLEDDFWLGYKKSGRGAYEITPKTAIHIDEVVVRVKVKGRRMLELTFDSSLSGTIPRNKRVRLVGNLWRRNAEEALMKVESVVYL
jgi:hypothetical protein